MTQLTQLPDAPETPDPNERIYTRLPGGSTPDRNRKLGTIRAWLKTQITKADVGLGSVDNVSAADLRARATHSGTQSADTLTDGTTNKAFLATERTKLTGIATGATANAADSALRDRTTHTGAQAISTVTGLQTALDAKAATSDLAAKAPLASPTFTGTPAGPTAAPGTNTTQLATTAFTQAAVSGASLAATTVPYKSVVGSPNLLQLIDMPSIPLLRAVPYANWAAIQDGTSTSDIQSYINAWLADCVGDGKTGILPRGRVPLAGALEQPGSGLRIVGHGPASVFYVLSGATMSTGSVIQTLDADTLWAEADYSSAANAQAQDIHLSNFLVDGNGVDANGLRLLGIGQRVEDVNIKDVGGYGVWLRYVPFGHLDDGTDWNTFEGVTVCRSGKHGFFFDRTTDDDVTRCKAIDVGAAADNTWDGFHTGPNSNFKGSHLHAYSEQATANRQRAGLYLEGAGANIEVSHFEGAMTASVIDVGTNNRVENSAFYARRGTNARPYTIIQAGSGGFISGTVGGAASGGPTNLVGVTWRFNPGSGELNGNTNHADLKIDAQPGGVCDWTGSGGGNTLVARGGTAASAPGYIGAPSDTDTMRGVVSTAGGVVARYNKTPLAVENNITSSGSSAADARPLTHRLNRVTVVGSSHMVLLPRPRDWLGESVTVVNATGTALTVYCTGFDYIDNAAAGGGSYYVTIPVNSSREFYALTDTVWS